MPLPLSGLRMAKSLDNAIKIRTFLRLVKYCFESRCKQLYVKDLKVFLTLSLDKFNSVDKNLKFTVDNFENGKIHFLDLENANSGFDIDIYRKSTCASQYTSFDSFEP